MNQTPLATESTTAEGAVTETGRPRWTLGPEHPDFGFTPDEWEQTIVARNAARPRPALPYRLNGRWSRKYDRCQDCGKTERGHAGRGFCFGCYFKHLGEFARNSPAEAAP